MGRIPHDTNIVREANDLIAIEHPERTKDSTDSRICSGEDASGSPRSSEATSSRWKIDSLR
jgi:hypothetical protein